MTVHDVQIDDLDEMVEALDSLMPVLNANSVNLTIIHI